MNNKIFNLPKDSKIDIWIDEIWNQLDREDVEKEIKDYVRSRLVDIKESLAKELPKLETPKSQDSNVPDFGKTRYDIEREDGSSLWEKSKNLLLETVRDLLKDGMKLVVVGATGAAGGPILTWISLQSTIVILIISIVMSIPAALLIFKYFKHKYSILHQKKEVPK